MNRTLALVALLASVVYVATAAAAAAFTARGSVEQVHVTGAKPESRLTLVDRRGHVVGSQRAGSLGGAVFRDVKPGAGYRVGQSRRLTVLPGR
jgi:predicted secreted Zn-dependent protease